MRPSRVVLGYHGCPARVAKAVFDGARLAPSENDYDWLGKGIYFWEHGPDRARQWAKKLKPRTKPAIVGAVIDLGMCLDLLDTQATSELKRAHQLFREAMRKEGKSLPENGKGLQRLNRAVIDFYLDQLEQAGQKYQTVRGCFIEGDEVFPRSGIYSESHIQIAVRDPSCVLGVFHPTL